MALTHDLVPLATLTVQMETSVAMIEKHYSHLKEAAPVVAAFSAWASILSIPYLGEPIIELCMSFLR
jgi:hypothetical protein